MPYGNERETSLPITFHLTGEDAITQNSHWRREFGFYYLVDGVETIWDLDGGTISGAYMNIKATYDGPVILALYSAYGNLILADGSDGYSVAMELSQTDTNSLDDWGLGVYDLYILDSGRQIRLLQGNVALNRNVT